ncbi:hypothetical protein Agub_g589, partial [Astrephomene gubernaculifera]
MPVPTKLGPLNEKEKAEFDNIGYDQITNCKDVKKLMRLEAYMRDEGFATTADAVASRLRELGQRAANSEQDPEVSRMLAEEQRRAAEEIAAWSARQRETDAALGAVSKESDMRRPSADPGVGGYPPVRAPAPADSTSGATARISPAAGGDKKQGGSKADSAVGTQVRSGREYYERWEAKAAAALAAVDREETTAPAGAPSSAASAASTAGLARSPQLTERLLELNRGLSPPERLVLSGQERAKGNEHFRAGEFAEAVEHYTLALGLRGAAGDSKLFANRAAAYIKLKMWDAAEVDATAALETEPGAVKVLIRRAAARLELRRPAEALADCDRALAEAADCREAAELRVRAVKALEEAGMKRMAIE